MSRTTRTLSRIVLVATTVAVAGAVAPLTAAGSGEEGPNIVVEDAGDQANAVTLPASARVGEVTNSTVALDMAMSTTIGGWIDEASIGLAMTLTSEITEVFPDGGYVALTSLDSVEATELPDGTDPSTVPCVGVSGVQLVQTFDAAANTVSVEAVDTGLDAAALACVEEFTSTQTQSTVVFPAEPIGPGASWTADVVFRSQGIEMPVTYHYTLTDMADGRYTIDATLASDLDVSRNRLSAIGTLSGSGTLSGAIDNPMDVSSSFEMTMGLASSMGGRDLTMTTDITTHTTSTPAHQPG
jgi:hypothetical protein